MDGLIVGDDYCSGTDCGYQDGSGDGGGFAEDGDDGLGTVELERKNLRLRERYIDSLITLARTKAGGVWKRKQTLRMSGCGRRLDGWQVVDESEDLSSGAVGGSNIYS